MVKDFRKSQLRIYLIMISVTILAIALAINLVILPKFEKILIEIFPHEVKSIKNRIYSLTAGLTIFTFLFNFYFLKVDNELKKEEEEAEMILKTNPKDLIFQEKLQRIKNKRKHYIVTIDLIFTVVFGFVIGFMVISLIGLLYRFLGTIR